MSPEKNSTLVYWVQRGIVFGAILNLALIGYGLIRFPSTLTAGANGVKGLVADLFILTAYAALGFIGARKTHQTHPATLRLGVRTGLAVALVYSVVVESEYIVHYDARTGPMLGKAMVLAVFSLFFLAGILGAFGSGQIRLGVVAAVWSACVGTLIWFGLVLLTYYFFLGTSRQTHVLELENHDDFARSGMTDYRAFIMQDFMGACFYHLLISPVFAAILGTVGGMLGSWCRRFRTPGS
jgi:hypothetical protein